MTTSVPYLRIKQEEPSQLTLISTDRRWLVLLFSFLLGAPLILVGILLMKDYDWVAVILPAATGLILVVIVLLFTSGRSQIVMNSNSSTITSSREYWLGIGPLKRVREKSWAFGDITETNVLSQGLYKLIEIKVGGKKELVLIFSVKAKKDAQRSYDILQSWFKGLPLDAPETVTILNEQENEKKIHEALKSAQKLLFYFGGFSLLSGAMGLFNETAITSSVSTYTIISIFTGVIYLACGYGAKQRSEIALWVAILVVLAERLYWFIQTRLLNGAWNFTSLLTWIFAFFIVSSLWKAIQSIRSMEDNSTFEPLA